jgi:hypothetical protein
MFKSHVRPIVRETVHNVYDYSIIRVYLLQNDPWVWKRLQSKQHYSVILISAWTACTSNDRRRELPSVLSLARTAHRGSILLLHLWQWKASLSRLMVATQQVGEKDDMGALDKERLTVVWLAESGGCILCQVAMTNASSFPPGVKSNIPQSPLW